MIRSQQNGTIDIFILYNEISTLVRQERHNLGGLIICHDLPTPLGGLFSQSSRLGLSYKVVLDYVSTKHILSKYKI